MKNKIYAIAILLLNTLTVLGQASSWQWAKTNGASGGYQSAYSIAVDASENIYVAGDFANAAITFDTIGSSCGSTGTFIAKFNSNGSTIWLKSVCGSNLNLIKNIVVDTSGNSFICGRFSGPSITFGTTTLTSVGDYDIFFVKYDVNGNVVWAKSMGGVLADEGNDVAVDVNGNSYITGSFKTPVISFGTITLFNSVITNSSMFVVKYDTSGNPVWAKSAKKSAGRRLKADDAGMVYLGGDFQDSTIIGSAHLYSVGAADMFFAKYDSNGTVMWVNSAGGTGGINSDAIAAMAIDKQGNSYVTGQFASPTLVFGTTSLTNIGNYDTFVVKHDSAGLVAWAKSSGGTTNDVGRGIDVDSIGNCYLFGTFSSSGTTIDSMFFPTAGADDILIAKYDTGGNVLWAKSVGGSGADRSGGIAVDAIGNCHITGTFSSNPLSFGNTNLPLASSQNIFIAKLGYCSARFNVYPDTIPHNWFALNQATGVAPLTYTWSWGDGTTSSGATPTHTYSTPGYYNICLTINDANGCSSTYCDSSTYLNKSSSNSMITLSVVTFLPTGIENIDRTSLVTLYPNPAANHLTITLPKVSQKGSVIITDITGKIIYNNADVLSQKLEVNTKDFSTGIYFVLIQTPDFVETKKLIIQK